MKLLILLIIFFYLLLFILNVLTTTQHIYINNIIILFFFLPLITLYVSYLYYKTKRKAYIYVLLIFILTCFIIFYNSTEYLKIIHIYLKMMKLDKDDKKFYIIFNKYAKSLFTINRIGNKSTEPCIYIANHFKNEPSSHLILGGLMDKNIKIFGLSSKTIRNAIDDNMGYIFIEDFDKYNKHDKMNKYDKIKELIKTQIENGYSVICFPEKQGKHKDDLNVFRSGFFRIAKELNISINLLAINWSCLKNKFIIPKLKTDIIVKYGKRIDISLELDDMIKDAKKELSKMIEEIM